MKSAFPPFLFWHPPECLSTFLSGQQKQKIEKLKAIWAHEKEAACDSDFDAMVAAVSLYAKYPSPANFQSATNAVGIYRAKATGEAAEKVDELSRLIVRECPNRAAVSDQLQAVIECKRKA